MIAIYLNTVLCAMLFYTCFCRLVRTSGETVPGVRLAFIVLAMASALCLSAPFLFAYKPTWPSLLMVGSMAFVQALTAKYWKDGVPCHFRKQPTLDGLAYPDTISDEDKREVHQ